MSGRRENMSITRKLPFGPRKTDAALYTSCHQGGCGISVSCDSHVILCVQVYPRTGESGDNIGKCVRTVIHVHVYTMNELLVIHV